MPACFFIVCVSSPGIPIVEPKVELRLAVPMSPWKKAEMSSLHIYNAGHNSDTSFTAIYHICVLQGSGGLSYFQGKEKEQRAKRFVP